MVVNVRILMCSWVAFFLASSSAGAVAKNHLQTSPRDKRTTPFARHAQAESDGNVSAIHEQNGKKLFKNERWVEAAREFAAAYTNRRDPAMLFNMALCYRRAGDIRHALGLYQRYLLEAPDSPNRTAVELRIKQLQEALAAGKGEADSVDPIPSPRGSQQIQQAPEEPQFQQQEYSEQQPKQVFSEPADTPQTIAPLQAGRFGLAYFGLLLPLGNSPSQSRHDAGLHLGGLAGFYMGAHVSINGEVGLDFLDPSGTTDEALLVFSFSPLIHFGSPGLEFAVGPRLGYFWDGGTIHGSNYSNTDFSASGLLYGLNMGAFFLPFRGLSFGGLVSLSAHSTQNFCQNDVCGIGTAHTSFELAFTVAVLAPRLCIRREGQCL